MYLRYLLNEITKKQLLDQTIILKNEYDAKLLDLDIDIDF